MEAAFLSEPPTKDGRASEDSPVPKPFLPTIRDFNVPQSVFKDTAAVSVDPIISPIPLTEEDLLPSTASKRADDPTPSASGALAALRPSPADPKGRSYPVSFVLLIEETPEKAVAASVELVAVSNTGRLWADTRRDKKRDQDSSRGSASSFCTLDTPKKDASVTDPLFPILDSAPAASAKPQGENVINERVIQVNNAPDASGNPEDIHVYVCVKEQPVMVGLRCSLVVLDATGNVNEPPLQTENLGLNGAMWEVGVYRIQPGQRGRWTENNEQQHTSPWSLMRPLPLSSDFSVETPAFNRPTDTTNMGVADDAQSRISKVKSKIYGKSKRIIFYTLTLEDLKGFFNLPRDEVARQLGICVTLLKKICRRNGIKQWPYRKLKNIDARIAALEHKSASINASAGPENWAREYASSIEVLKRERDNVVSLQDSTSPGQSSSGVPLQ